MSMINNFQILKILERSWDAENSGYANGRIYKVMASKEDGTHHSIYTITASNDKEFEEFFRKDKMEYTPDMPAHCLVLGAPIDAPPDAPMDITWFMSKQYIFEPTSEELARVKASA